jgi:CheY-like chemotaxis protein
MNDQPILIVDDDDDGRFVLGYMLTSQGYRVSLAANGAEGLEIARKEPPSLILLDLMMPVMDGVEFRHVQATDAVLASVPCLIVSAHFDAPKIAQELGAAGWVKKPISYGNLLSQVSAVLGR